MNGISRPRAVVFANHDVGVRCLSALMAAGIEVALVVAHDDEPSESIGFASVVETAAMNDLPVAMPDNAGEAEFVRRVIRLRPDFIFSFYYRQMLPPQLLGTARRGALNMHGSLLPRYRGRAPVNWAVIRGESETGATLHYMVGSPDAGDIVDQQAVPILPDDTAFDVFQKVTVAAEIVLCRSLPALIAGTAPRIPQDADRASYYGRRRPEDGAIDWRADAKTVHDLVRGVAPPYPGAFTTLAGRRLRVLLTRPEPQRHRRGNEPLLYVEDDACFADCGAGGVLRLIRLELEGAPIDARTLRDAMPIQGPWRLEPSPEKQLS